MDATLVCLPQCLLVTHFPDGKPQSLHAVLRKAFMAFAGLDQGEVINHEAEDVHHDFFPLQDHPALNSPCNPHPLGGHYCRARTTCLAGLFGLNDIDHGGRQVWADTRYGIAGGEHERVHAETFALVPQPHKQHIPAYHATHFDNNDLLLGTHAAIDVYEADAAAAVVSAAAADATRWPLDDEMVEDDYLDDPPIIDAAATSTAPERHGDGRAPPADVKGEGDVDSSISFRDRRDCHDRHNCCMFAPFVCG
ncbi:Os01g0573600 [Oryza sativa Japonica Group]|nr:Os01g0573600 [Oryza sativa Japonica Group]